MTTTGPARSSWWRAVGRAFGAMGRMYVEQACTWDAWAAADGAAVPDDGPLTWARTVDGYRLHGSYLPVGSGTR